MCVWKASQAKTADCVEIGEPTAGVSFSATKELGDKRSLFRCFLLCDERSCFAALSAHNERRFGRLACASLSREPLIFLWGISPSTDSRNDENTRPKDFPPFFKRQALALKINALSDLA